MTTQTVLIGLGSNLPAFGHPPARVVPMAAEALAVLGPVRLSPLYDSPAWPDPREPAYVNAVAAADTALTPLAVLRVCQMIERAFGRRRDPANRNAPRPLDLDVLTIGSALSGDPALIVPHPRLVARDFVLLPLRDLVPDWRHPETDRPVNDLVNDLPARTATRRTPGV